MNLKIPFSIVSLIILNLLIPSNAENANAENANAEKSNSGPLKVLQNVSGPIGNVMTLISFFKELIAAGDDSQEKYQRRLTQAFNDIHDISIKVSGMTKAIENLGKDIVSTLTEIEINRAKNEHLVAMNNILKESKLIDNEFRDSLLPLLLRYKTAPQRDITDFDDKVNKQNDILSKLRLIREWTSGLAPDELNSIQQNVFSIAMRYYQSLEKNKNYCGASSIYNRLYQLFEYMLATVSEGYSMIFMTYEFRQRTPGNTDTWRGNQVDILKEYKNIAIAMTASANSYLNKINETAYKKSQNCDPEKWAEGVNYIRLKNHVSYYEPSTKWYNDPNAKYLSNEKPEMECNSTQVFWNPSATSKGVVYSLNCPYIFLSDYTRDSSCQRFQNDKFTKSKNINWKSACTSGDNSRLEQLCSCDKQVDQDTSIRTISLREHHTDRADSRVVTGIRFIVKNNTIMLRIREGKLVNGTIIPQTVKWIDDDGQLPQTGSDTVQLSYDIRAFELDDIELPDQHLVTGVKLILTNEKRISLAVKGSAMYNDKKRTFPSIHDRWYYSTPNQDIARFNIDIKYLKNPVDLNDHNHEVSTSGLNYIDFTSSVYSPKDKNVAIIPFIDSRELVTDPPIALGGLGIFYKSKPGHGGFIALRYFTAEYNIRLDKDYAQTMNSSLSELLNYL